MLEPEHPPEILIALVPRLDADDTWLRGGGSAFGIDGSDQIWCRPRLSGRRRWREAESQRCVAERSDTMLDSERYRRIESA